MFSSPDATLSASTDQLLDEGRRSYSRNLSVLSDESGDVSTRQRFAMSVMHISILVVIFFRSIC